MADQSATLRQRASTCHARGDCLAVEPVRVAAGGLEGVSKRVAIVELGANVRFLALVLFDDLCLQFTRSQHDVPNRRRFAPENLAGRLLKIGEEIGIENDAIFDDLREPAVE